MNFIGRYLVLFYQMTIISFVFCQDKSNTTAINANITKSKANVTTEAYVNLSPKPSPIPVKPPKLICPGPDVPRPFFTLRCSTTKDCEFLGKGILCCNRRCIKGVPPPKPEPVHEPTWFGLVQRSCPKEPIPEVLGIKQCLTDSDCSPRICCPETFPDGTIVNFCRIAHANFDNVPIAKRIVEPIQTLMSYMQCTPPPPPVLDLFPKECSSPLDCFPNLCCQERGRQFCRPPKRSLLALVAGVSQRIIPTRTARRFIERIAS